MRDDEKDRVAWNAIQYVAKRILSGEIDLANGAKEICALRLNVGESANEVFYAFRALESDLDRFPVGKTRQTWDSTALAILDAERGKILERMSPSIKESCMDILKRFPEIN